MNYFFIILLFLFPSILLAGTESDLVLPTNNETILSSNQEIDDFKKNIKYPLTKTQKDTLESLFKTLNDKEIKIKPSFKNPFKVLKKEKFNDFCEKIDYFFQHINEKIKDTGFFTGMLQKQKHVNNFLLKDKAEIAYVASQDLLENFSFMFHGKGLPTKEGIQSILDWQELKKESGEFNEDLFQSFSTMYYRKGLPTQKDVQDILDWPQFKIDNKFNLPRFKSFASFHRRKGRPSISDVENFFNKDKILDRNPTLESIIEDLSYELNPDQKDALETLFNTLIDKKINIKPSFNKLLKILKKEDFSAFFKKTDYFFQHINKEIKDTGFFTSMLSYPKNINNFISRSDKELAYLASHDLLKSFSSIYAGKGLPTKEDAQGILEWQELKTESGEFNTQLFTSFSTMYHGKGLLTREDVKYIISFSQFKFDGKFHLPLLKSFASFYKNKGRPSTTDVEKFFNNKNKKLDDIPTVGSIKEDLCYELNPTQEEALESLFKTLNDKKINIKQSFSDLFNIIKQKNFNDFCKKTDYFFQHINRKIKDTGFFTSMITAQKHIINFISRNDKELAYLASCDLLQSFATMHNNKGLPKQENLQAILDLQELKTESGEFNTQLFKSISTIYLRKGIPTKKDIQEILSLSYFKVDNKFHLPLFKYFASFHKGKGRLSTNDVEKFFKKDKKLNDSPTVESIIEDLSYALNPDQEDALKSLFKTLNDKKLNIKSSFNHPFKVLKEEKFNDFCKKTDHFFQHVNLKIKNTGFFTSMIHSQKQINDFISRSDKELADLASHHLLQSFSTMCSSKGLPTQQDIDKILEWQEWKTESGEFNEDLFKSVSPIYSGKGFPTQEDVQNIISWVNIKNSTHLVLIKLMLRLYYHSKIPHHKKLIEQEKMLFNLFFNKESTQNIEEKIKMQLKIITLFLTTNKPQYHIHLNTIDKFHKESKLDSLIQIDQLTTLLLSYGGTIINYYVNLDLIDQEKLINYAKDNKPRNMIQEDFPDLMKFIYTEHQKYVLLLTQESTDNIDPDFVDSTQQPFPSDNEIIKLLTSDSLDDVLNLDELI